MAEDEPRREPAPGEPAGPADSAEVGSPAGEEAAGSLAETREQPGIAETAEQPAADDRADAPAANGPDVGPTGTSVLPAVTKGEPGSPRWSARAQVPPPDLDDATAHPSDWDAALEHPQRSALVPVLVTICVLLLLALLGLGVWLVLANRGTNPVTPPISPTSGPVSPTAPAQTKTTNAPSPTTPAAVAIPDLRGQDYAAAAAALKALGFVPSRSDETNADVPAGKVSGTDPPAGTKVIPGATIHVIVSAGVPTHPAPSKTSEQPN